MVGLFLASGFEEIEALATVDVLRRAEIEVKTIGIGSDIIEGAHRISVAADMRDEQLNLNSLDMVILPGGMPGTLNLEKSGIVREAVSYCARQGKVIAAICAAPSILGHMGLLDEKRATCFPGFEQELGRAVHTNSAVEVDGDIITARGAGVAVDFALAIVKKLKGEDLANHLRASMQCKNESYV